MPTNLVIRDATPDDAPALARIHIAARAVAMPWLAVVHTDQQTEHWMASQVIGRQRVRVAIDDGAAVGLSAMTDGWLEQLYIRPGHQRRGVGSALFRDACASTNGGFRFWVFQRNAAARSFYERHGCRLLELTDGRANEEDEPDALYLYEKQEIACVSKEPI